MDKAAPTEIKELEGVGVDNVACGAQHTLYLCRYATASAALKQMVVGTCRTPPQS